MPANEHVPILRFTKQAIALIQANTAFALVFILAVAMEAFLRQERSYLPIEIHGLGVERYRQEDAHYKSVQKSPRTRGSKWCREHKGGRFSIADTKGADWEGFITPNEFDQAR